ncbi:Hypothetical predicted protein [Cloeon dipterum]|uniref:LRRNT domain-containing protein n=2 Tax=Cloeon dipterum TaxID=197152 RepID=A0A8S1DDS6_9INSE|nr:Hypothetical predicted protein [Cloeon dipterum]
MISLKSLGLVVIFLVAGCNCNSTSSDNNELDVCEIDTELTCKNLTRGTNCGCVSKGTKAKCCHFKLNLVADYLYNNCGFNELTALYFFNCSSLSQPSISQLDLSPILKKYPNLQTLAFTNSDYNMIKVDPKVGNISNVRCLNVSYNSLDNSTDVANVINSIPSLQLIDVSNNNLSHAPNISGRSDFSLHIANNEFLNCDGIKEQMLENIKFVHPDQTLCRKFVTITQWSKEDTVSLNLSSIASTIMIHKQCPPKCSCSESRIVTEKGENNQNQVSNIAVAVNCSYRHLTKMPESLPTYTTTLDVSHNNITSLNLNGLKPDSNYDKLNYINANYNEIKTLQTLEGSEFLKAFEYLSLKGNQISKIPHFLEKAVTGTPSGKGQILLSDNKFECNCDTALHMKPMLVALEKHIVDFENIYCNNMEIKIIDLVNEKVCTINEINYIYYIIVAEVLLLLLLVGKVSYDYWVFKHVGYLPWPASKMPRLPCDCVLEN